MIYIILSVLYIVISTYLLYKINIMDNFNKYNNLRYKLGYFLGLIILIILCPVIFIFAFLSWLFDKNKGGTE